MGDPHQRPLTAQAQQVVGDGAGGAGVEVGGGFVQDEHRLVGQQEASEAETGALAAGDRGGAVTDAGRQTLGE